MWMPVSYTHLAEGWRLATELGVPMVDEHYYVDPGWMIHNQDYYDPVSYTHLDVYKRQVIPTGH